MSRWPSWIVAAVIGLGAGAGAMLLVDRQSGAGTRDYLLAHPEVIPEAMQRLRDRETARIIAPGRVAIETPTGSAWAGNPRGDVTLVEYYDDNCGYCRASLPTGAALLKSDPGARGVSRERPTLAPASVAAARASGAAARQGRYAGFRDALYAAGPVSDATIAAAALAAGVDTRGTPAPADEATIAANLKAANELGMTGTPGWVVGDRVMIGAQTLEALQDAVAAARRR